MFNTPKEIAENYVATGVAKTKLPISKMLMLGFLAGMFIALASVGQTFVSASLSGSWSRFTSAFVFPAGLAMVLIAGSELFTGNNLIIISVLQKEAKAAAMLKNWFFVYIGNFIGSIVTALIFAYGGVGSFYNNEIAISVIEIAVAKTSLSFGDALLRGILCNFLVCIAVWMSFAAKDIAGKFLALFMPIWLFVIAAFEHSIANMYYIPAGLFALNNINYRVAFIEEYGAGSLLELSWGTLWSRNLIPVTIGNLIGGVVLVGMVYWFIYLRDTGKKTVAGGKKKK